MADEKVEAAATVDQASVEVEANLEAAMVAESLLEVAEETLEGAVAGSPTVAEAAKRPMSKAVAALRQTREG